MSRTRVRTLQECANLIGEMRASGKSKRAWCAEKGINIKTFQYWEKRLDNEKKRISAVCEPESTEWVEVKDPTPAMRPEFAAPPIEVRIGRYEMSISSGFDRDLFIGICEVLSGLC